MNYLFFFFWMANVLNEAWAQSGAVSRAFNAHSHRVVAALSDDDPAGKCLVVDFNLERPVSAIERVLLDEVQVIDTCNLNTEKNSLRHVEI